MSPETAFDTVTSISARLSPPFNNETLIKSVYIRGDVYVDLSSLSLHNFRVLRYSVSECANLLRLKDSLRLPLLYISCYHI